LLSVINLKQLARASYEEFDVKRRKTEAEQVDTDDLAELERIQKRHDDKSGDE